MNIFGVEGYVISVIILNSATIEQNSHRQYRHHDCGFIPIKLYLKYKVWASLAQ